MDYMKFVEHHRNTDADITIGCLPVDHERATDFGLMKINDEGQILVRRFCRYPNYLENALLARGLCLLTHGASSQVVLVIPDGLCRILLRSQREKRLRR